MVGLLQLLLGPITWAALFLTHLTVKITWALTEILLRSAWRAGRTAWARRQARAAARPAPEAAPEPRPQPKPAPRPEPLRREAPRAAAPALEPVSAAPRAGFVRHNVEEARILDVEPFSEPTLATPQPGPDDAPRNALPPPFFDIPPADGAVYATDGFTIWPATPIDKVRSG